jgi:hypothetical protein
LPGCPDGRSVLLGPGPEGTRRLEQARPEFGEAVLNVRRDGGVLLADDDDAVAFEVAQGRGKDLRGHPRDHRTRPGDALRSALQGDEDQKRPLVCEDRRAPHARLTEAGWATVQAAAPGHVANVRHHVVDALSDEQIDQLAEIGDAILARLDPTGSMAATYTRYDEELEPPTRERAAAE